MSRASLALGCVIGLVASARADDHEELRAPDVTVTALADAPSSYDGQTVRVTGEIHAVLGPRVFSLRGPGLLWARKILVVAPRAPGQAPLAADTKIRVEGIVYAHGTRQLAIELGLPAVEARDVDGRPVLVARWISKGEP